MSDVSPTLPSDLDDRVPAPGDPSLAASGVDAVYPAGAEPSYSEGVTEVEHQTTGASRDGEDPHRYDSPAAKPVLDEDGVAVATHNDGDPNNPKGEFADVPTYAEAVQAEAGASPGADEQGEASDPPPPPPPPPPPA